MKTRNLIARSLADRKFAQHIVKPKRGRGSYKRPFKSKMEA